MQASRGLRRGKVFSVRIAEDERAELEDLQRACGGPRSLGPWLVWQATRRRRGNTRSSCAGSTRARVLPGPGTTPTAERLILDLCGGSGAWSAPYRDAGYPVQLVTLPESDVRTYVPPANVWGILAAPPCTMFSLARNGHPGRDFVEGMACVNACMRIVLQARPRWWALENPAGYLSKFLGCPSDTFQPYDFGDPWSKRTRLWGEFVRPERGPFVEPTGSAMDRSTAAERALTPPSFARAFFRANP